MAGYANEYVKNAVDSIVGTDATMIDYADAALAILDHIGLTGKDYDKIAEMLANTLESGGHIEDDDDGVNYDKVLARLKGEEV